MTRAAGYWSIQPEIQHLRLRAIATLPWAEIAGIAVTPPRRHQLELDLPHSGLAREITALSQRRGAELPPMRWNRGPNRNALDAASYSSIIAAPDGQVALTAEVMIITPQAADSPVCTCAELRINDLGAWARAITAATGAPSEPNLRLSPTELTEFFVVAWHTATETLPAIITGDTVPAHWIYPPTIELRMTAEHRADNTPYQQPVLDNYIDLGSLGSSDRGPLREMAVTITAPPLIEPAARRRITGEALAYTAQHSGLLPPKIAYKHQSPTTLQLNISRLGAAARMDGKGLGWGA